MLVWTNSRKAGSKAEELRQGWKEEQKEQHALSPLLRKQTKAFTTYSTGRLVVNDPFSAQRGSEEAWQRRALFTSNYTLRLKPQLFQNGSCKTLQTQNCHFSSSATHFLIKAQGGNHDFEPHAIQATCVSNVLTAGQHPHTTSLHLANESTELPTGSACPLLCQALC